MDERVPPPPEGSVLDGDGPDPALDEELSRLKLVAASVFGLVLLATAITVGVVFWLARNDTSPLVDFLAIQPGSTHTTDDIVGIGGIEIFDAEGEIEFVTVSVSDFLTADEKEKFEADPVIDVVPAESILGDRTRQEKRENDQVRMETSQDIAIAVALDHLGYEGEISGTGVVVRETFEQFPASETLQAGDVVVAVDGVDTFVTSEFVEIVQAAEPGDVLTFTIERDGITQLVEVPLGENPEQEGQALVGITIAQRDYTADYGFDVDIEAGNVGGPSAGLAFTLTILDVLTPGELTGGSTVVATGEILLDGSIGPVGGVRQKAVAAMEAGADVFIVPSATADDAREVAPGLDIAPVDTLEEALAVLDALGGNALALGRPGAVDS